MQASVAVTTNVRTGPATTFQVAGQISPAATVDVVGTNETGDWLQIRFSDAKDGLGWVLASLTDFSGEKQNLPIVKDIPTSENSADTGDGAPASVTFSSLAVDPDNTLFAVVGSQGVQLYSLVSYEFVRLLDAQGLLAGDAAWSADGKRFAVGLYSQDETAQRINLGNCGWRLVDQRIPGIGVSVVSRVAGRPAAGVGCDFGFLYGILARTVVDVQKEFATSGSGWSGR